MTAKDYMLQVQARLQKNTSNLSEAKAQLAAHTKAAKAARKQVKELEAMTSQDSRIVEDLAQLISPKNT